MTTHEIPGPPFRLWSTDHEPVLAVSDGDVVEFTVQDASGGVYDDAQTGTNPPELDFHQVYLYPVGHPQPEQRSTMSPRSRKGTEGVPVSFPHPNTERRAELAFFVGPPPSRGQTPGQVMDTFDEERIEAVGSRASEYEASISDALHAWASDCEVELARFGGHERVFPPGQGEIRSLLHPGGAYLDLSDELDADEWEEILAAMRGLASKHSLMAIYPLQARAFLPNGEELFFDD